MTKLTFIGRMGGKYRQRTFLADLIQKQTFKTYCEPFLGGGQVFMELNQDTNKLYVLNDNNKDIYDLWNDIRTIDPDVVRKYQFIQSREIFDELKQQKTIKNINKRLFRNLYLSLFSYSYNRIAFAPKYETKGQHIKNNIEKLQNKMKDVVLLNEDYKSVLKQYDSPTTIFYLDPPYVKMEKYYEEQSIDPHELANVCSTLQGKFVLSYSNDPIVLDAFRDEKFFISEVPMTYTSGRKSKRTTEILITNFFIL